MLRRLSMVLALAAAVGCTDTSETSDGAVAADDGELAAERAPAVASSPPATGTAAQQATNIPCPGKHVEREVRVTKAGGEKQVPGGLVRITFSKESYPTEPVQVRVIPAGTHHGVGLEPAPEKTVLLELVLGECEDNDSDGLGRYQFRVGSGQYPAAVVDRGNRSWAIGAIPPEAWSNRVQADSTADLFTGFVILSN